MFTCALNEQGAREAVYKKLLESGAVDAYIKSKSWGWWLAKLAGKNAWIIGTTVLVLGLPYALAVSSFWPSLYIHTYMHTCILAYIHTYMHTYIHTYIHIYIHTYCVCAGALCCRMDKLSLARSSHFVGFSQRFRNIYLSQLVTFRLGFGLLKPRSRIIRNVLN
jgi:hypothetical protein